MRITGKVRVQIGRQAMWIPLGSVVEVSTDPGTSAVGPLTGVSIDSLGTQWLIFKGLAWRDEVRFDVAAIQWVEYGGRRLAALKPKSAHTASPAPGQPYSPRPLCTCGRAIVSTSSPTGPDGRRTFMYRHLPESVAADDRRRLPHSPERRAKTGAGVRASRARHKGS